MPAGQRLIASPGDQELDKTVSREGAMSAAVSYLAEQGVTQMLLSLDGDRRYFTLSELKDAYIAGLPPLGRSVRCLEPIAKQDRADIARKKQQVKRSAGRPPAMGWNDVSKPSLTFLVEPVMSRLVGERKRSYDSSGVFHFMVHVAFTFAGDLPAETVIKVEELMLVEEMRRQGAEGNVLGYAKHKFKGGVEPCEGATDVYICTHQKGGGLRAVLRSYKA